MLETCIYFETPRNCIYEVVILHTCTANAALYIGSRLSQFFLDLKMEASVFFLYDMILLPRFAAVRVYYIMYCFHAQYYLYRYPARIRYNTEHYTNRELVSICSMNKYHNNSGNNTWWVALSPQRQGAGEHHCEKKIS